MPPPTKPPVVARPASPDAADPQMPVAGAAPIVKPLGPNHIQRLQRSLSAIDSNPATPSSARSILSGYYRFLNPNMTLEHLPRSLRPHKLHPENAANTGTKWDIILFYFGDAAGALQQAYSLDRVWAGISDKQENAKKIAQELAERAIHRLEAAVARLERLARAGPNDWVSKGTESQGYYLVTSYEHMKSMEAATAD